MVRTRSPEKMQIPLYANDAKISIIAGIMPITTRKGMERMSEYLIETASII